MNLITTRSGENTASNLSVNDPVISDHPRPAVHCILDFERPSNKKLVLTSRKLSNISANDIRQDICSSILYKAPSTHIAELRDQYDKLFYPQ